MKPIKFRAWNEDENRWALCEEFSQVKINPTLDQFGGGSKGADLQNMTALEVGTAPLVLMQYTGLKDKNGIEIYESDIVKRKGWSKKGYETGHYSYTYEIYFDDEKAMFMAGEKLSLHNLLTLDGTVEVIGNIYQNPELLRGAV